MLFLLLFTAWQATQVRSSLTEVADRLSVMSNQLASGKAGKAEAALDDAAEAADEAHTHSRGPVWWLGSKLPWIGDDVTAVRVVSEVARDLSDQTLPELVEAGGSFSPEVLTPKNGRFDLAPIAEVAPALEQGATEIGASADRVAGLDKSGLIAQLQDPVIDLEAKLTQARNLSTQAAAAANLLPTMLGGEEQRTYLLIFQNNAEIRAQGGMPGAIALVNAKNGKIDMVSQGAPRDIGTFPEPFVELTAEERELFTPRIAIYPQDTVFVPDFARSSDILKQMWDRTHAQELDGVISMDPVAMSYLLRGTGPITLDSGRTLTADNAADVLMREVYLEVASDEEQNTLFADAARKMFEALRSGQGDSRAMLEGLTQGVSERRLMLWSDHEEEQQRIDTTAIAGELPVEAGDRPEVGLYINDSSADKLSYYLDYKVDVTPRACGPDGSQVLDVRLTARSTVPPGASLPPSVVGPPTNPVPPGVLLNSFYLYAPVGGRIDEATLEGEEAPMGRYTYRGRKVGAITLDLEPGEERVVDYELRTGPGQTGEPRLLSTPSATGTGAGTIAASAC